MTVLDAGVIVYVVSTAFCSRLHLSMRQVRLRITMADSREAVVVGEILYVPTTIEHITVEASCLNVRRVPYILIVGRLSANVMRLSLDSGKDVVAFRHHGGTTQIPLKTDGMQTSSTLSERSTSERGRWERAQTDKTDEESIDEESSTSTSWLFQNKIVNGWTRMKKT